MAHFGREESGPSLIQQRMRTGRRVTAGSARKVRDPLRRVGRIPTAVLSDALGRLGTMVSGIKPVTAAHRLVGIARTVRCFPGDFLTLLTALAEAREGEVLVVDGGGHLEAALLGQLMAVEARRKGVRGFVIDGAVRELSGLEETGLPIFARAATPRLGGAEHLLETQVPIICGGAPVRPGDVVCGDEDGVVVFAEARLGQVVSRALDVRRHEREVVRHLRRGRPLAEIMRLFDRLVELRKRG
ncbi:MAG TPA: RraA family protein [Candidatus Baltobacteraceae bacterium]|nr:RraA family protein [Candidatus Baltobacteraceae bacterium]